MRQELRATFLMAWPVVLTEVGWVLMGILDTVFVGPLGPAAIGAVGTGSTMFFAVMVFGIGTTYALDHFVAADFGAGRLDDCHRWLVAGLSTAVLMSIVLTVVGVIGISLLGRSGIHPDVLRLLQPYLRTLIWSAPPLLLYSVLRRYLQAMNVVRPLLLVILLANVVNAVGNWVLIYGHLGAPALGVVGSAYATLLGRVAMLAALSWIVVRRERAHPSGLRDVAWTWDRVRVVRIARLGLPIAFQIVMEVGVFTVAAVFAAQISPTALAANQIVLNIASFFFMIPLGLSSAAAVRVGQAVGRGSASGARLAGWSAMGLAVAMALGTAAAFLAVPSLWLRIFSRDPGVIAAGTGVLLVYAFAQPFDNLQSVATGALRGLGHTRLPMWLNLVAYWAIALPLAWFLCFTKAWAVVGLWAGLSAGLVIVATGLAIGWARYSSAPLLEPDRQVVSSTT